MPISPPRMESVRVQMSGNRSRPRAASSVARALTSRFSASYYLVTAKTASPRRLSLAHRPRRGGAANVDQPTTRRASGWSRPAPRTCGPVRRSQDVDVVLSPFFNTLPIRPPAQAQQRVRGHPCPPSCTSICPTSRCRRPRLTYSSGARRHSVLSPVSSSSIR
ncbi:hypothetical protein GS539_18675 [Rhodococcus hoagii]|nr:hypothetical protein [Prescottella equi]